MNNSTHSTPSWAEGLDRPVRRGLPLGNWEKIITAADIAAEYEEQEEPAPVDIVDREPSPYGDFPKMAELEEQHRAEALSEGYGQSWEPVDLSDVLDGDWTPPAPSLMQRDDGHALLYPGMVHTFQGESESGKSMLAQAVAAETLQAGGRVLYLDFESDRGTVAQRLLLLGATREQILQRFDYMNPDEDPTTPRSLAYPSWLAILNTEYALAVVDGVNESLSVFGRKLLDNDDITAWGRAFPRQLAKSTGAAVVCIDHVTKSKDGRGRYAIGGQAKLAYLTGASYTVEPEDYLAPGKVGALSIRVGKDRPGGVRAHAGEHRAEDRSQLAARAVIDSRDPSSILYTLEAPPKPAEVHPGETFRLTGLMEKISREYEQAAEDGTTLTARELDRLVPGGKTYKARATKSLAAEGYLRKASDQATSPWVHVRPYRQADDPESDRYQPTIGG